MIIIPDKLDFDYKDFRNGNDIFKKYLALKNIKTIDFGEYFGWYKKIFGKYFYIVKFHRVGIIPNIEKIKKTINSHGLIIWTPSKNLDTKGWVKFIFSSYCYSGINIIDKNNYKKDWSERGKRSLKKFEKYSNLKIKKVENEEFLDFFKSAKTNIPYKNMFIKQHFDFSKINSKIRNFICYDDKKNILGGLSVVDYSQSSSVHLVSFLTLEGKKNQVGTGLINEWFKDSILLGLKYLNFDHLRDKYMSKNQSGYSEFKENFITYKIDYSKTYFKFF